MRKLLSQIIAAGAGLWLATLIIPAIEVRAYPASNFFGFPLTEQWQIFLLLGLVLGLLNYFLRPLLKTLALPLEIITLGLFTILIDLVLVWFLDLLFDELTIPLFLPLLYIVLIIYALNIIIGRVLAKKEE